MTTDSHQFLYQEHQPQHAQDCPTDAAVHPVANSAAVHRSEVAHQMGSVAHLLQTRSVVQPPQPTQIQRYHAALPMQDTAVSVELRQRVLRVVLVSSLLGMLLISLISIGGM